MEAGEITPTSATPSSCCSFEYIVTSRDESFEIQNRRLLREIDEMNCRYEDCFRRLQLLISEIDHLRDENLRLAAENLELLFLVEELEASAATGGVEPDHVSEEKKEGDDQGNDQGDDQNPSLPQISGSGKGEARGGTPKSISIRSSGFHTVKTTPLSWRKGAGSRAAASDTKRTHRLRLQGGDGEAGEEASGEVEVEVFDQGTVKTELCNKWGELGWCPYGSRCQFAHGLGELRPVIRHPRYKTQLCRMLSSPDGSGCPYGHRCHFRHSLPKAP